MKRTDAKLALEVKQMPGQVTFATEAERRWDVMMLTGRQRLLEQLGCPRSLAEREFANLPRRVCEMLERRVAFPRLAVGQVSDGVL
jgi:hypothetical protein